jgi:hypothetical protein
MAAKRSVLHEVHLDHYRRDARDILGLTDHGL